MTATATLYVTHQGFRTLRHLYFEILRLLYHLRLKIGKMANFLTKVLLHFIEIPRLPYPCVPYNAVS